MSDAAPRSRRQRWLSHLGTVVLMLVVFFGVQAWQTRAVPKALDAAMLDLPLPTLRPGQAPSNSTLRAELAALQQQHPGQNVALYVWAEWCPICKTTQGTVQALGADRAVLTVAMQSGGPEGDLRWPTVGWTSAWGMRWRLWWA